MSKAMRLSGWLLIPLAGVGAGWADEFVVNEFTFHNQNRPSISENSSAGFVVAWHSYYAPTSTYRILARRFNRTGGALGLEFRVNLFLSGGIQKWPTISQDSSGAFVVAWEVSSVDGSGYGVFARRFDSSGSALGAEFQVNQHTTGNQRFPAVSKDSSGGFVVTWQSYGQDGFAFGVFGRRFDSSGNALGAEFQVNQFTTSNQDYPAISHNSSDGFVVTWQSNGQDGSGYGILGRRFDSSGNALDSEFLVNQVTINGQLDSAISHSSSGGFVVVWEDFTDTSNFGVFGLRFDSSGGVLGQEFRVNQVFVNAQRHPTISHNSSGGFVVAWQSFAQDGHNYGVFARRFDSSGSALGGDFQVNQFAMYNQRYATISHESSGAFMVAWESFGQDGSGYGILGQVFPVPTVTTGAASGGASLVRRYQGE